MSEKLTIEYVKYSKRNGYGGKEKDYMGIKCAEYDKWLNGFCWSGTKELKKGDVLVAEVVESGNFLNVKAPKDTPATSAEKPVVVKPSSEPKLLTLESRVELLEHRVSEAARIVKALEDALDAKADKF